MMSTEEIMCQNVLEKYNNKDSLSEKEKDELLSNMAFLITSFVYKQENTKKEKNSDIRMYKVHDIMEIYSCEANKARQILKTAHVAGLATKMGNSYVITEKNLNKFNEMYLGKVVKL